MKKFQQIVYLILIFATFLDILLLADITFYPSVSSVITSVEAFDLILCIVLWLEFIYSYIHSDNKRQYLKENAFSILGMLPVNLVFLRALRLVKLAQLINIFILSRDEEQSVSKFLKQTHLEKVIVLSIIFIFALTVLIRIFDSNIGSIRTALWYIIVSMTSTGYGDIVPASTSGRIIGSIAMIGGILIFSTITAVISSVYISRVNRDHHDSLESKIEDLTSEIEKLNGKIDDLKNNGREE